MGQGPSQDLEGGAEKGLQSGSEDSPGSEGQSLRFKTRGSQRERGAKPPKLVHPSGESLSSLIRFSKRFWTP